MLTLTITKYAVLFLVVYFQVFLLLTFLGWKKRRMTPGIRMREISPEPHVAIIVPCFNEEKTVAGTIISLLELEYPAEKLHIIVVDDGSTDSTWSVMQPFSRFSQVTLFTKQNEGSKFSALNFALEQIPADVEVIGCLDADSHVAPSALRKSLVKFEDPVIGAVVPSMIIDRPKTFFQYLQKVEYEIGLYVRRVFSDNGGLYVAPGPFTLFRKEVFEKMGNYLEAHHTEDLEMALRIQANGLQLVYATEAVVYTKGPATWAKLLKQRVRWTYGFIMNAIDYRRMFFNPRYGNLGMFVLPFSFLVLIVAVVSFPFLLWQVIHPIITMIRQIALVGVHFNAPSFDMFFINTNALSLLGIGLLGLSMFMLVYARKRILRMPRIITVDILTVAVYPFFSSIWVLKSVWNALRSRQDSW